MGVLMSFEILFSFRLDIYIEMELLDHSVVLVLIFWGTYILFSIVAAPIYIPSNRAQGFVFLHIFAAVCYRLSFFYYYYSHSNNYEVISVVLICISWWLVMLSTFHVPVNQLTICMSSLGKCLFSSSACFIIVLFEMETHSSTLAWRIPWMEEPAGYSPWCRKELDTTEWLHFHFGFFHYWVAWVLYVF